MGNYSLRQWGPAYWGRGVQNTGKEELHRVILPLVVPKYKRSWFSEGERSCPCTVQVPLDRAFALRK